MREFSHFVMWLVSSKFFPVFSQVATTLARRSKQALTAFCTFTAQSVIWFCVGAVNLLYHVTTLTATPGTVLISVLLALAPLLTFVTVSCLMRAFWYTPIRLWNEYQRAKEQTFNILKS